MEREFKTAKVIIAVGSVIASYIAFANEDLALKLLGVALFTAIAVAISYFGTGISRKIIEVGDRISNKFLRVLYYVGIFAGIVIAVALMYMLALVISDSGEHKSLSAALSEVLLLLFAVGAFAIIVFIPYLQALLVLLLSKIQKLRKK